MELNAPEMGFGQLQQISTQNAYTFSFEPQFLAEIQQHFTQDLAPYLAQPNAQKLLAGGRVIRKKLPQLGYGVFSYDDYPLLWFSNGNHTSYARFLRFFEALNPNQRFKTLLPFDSTLRLYCGFFVIGDRAPAPLWHEDYRQGAQALTLITPLFDLAPEHGHLLYETQEG